MPPVAMMTVVLPAFKASRTSIHVISSSHMVFGAGSGLGASTQLYAFRLQLPPPLFRAAAAAESGAEPCWDCASAEEDVRIAALKIRAAFMVFSCWT
jgi:hypothetical protein